MKKQKPEAIIQSIVAILSGKEWDSDTPADIADILTANGYEIKEPE